MLTGMTRKPFACFTPLLVGLVASVVAGCAENKPYRTNGKMPCTEGCMGATIEEHHNAGDSEVYDLAFVEFTERGNVFDRDRLKLVLDHVRESANPRPTDPYEGVMVVVFVHGWKHNASLEDENVEQFRNLLRKAARLASEQHRTRKLAKRPRKLIGIYVGWRGSSITLPVVEELTFWDRKNVAEKIGKGGVTELLIQLEQILIGREDRKKEVNRNLYLVVGHSFGGAIVLSAINEVLLERVISAEPAKDSKEGCVVSRPFGHGVALLNAAMEANEVYQLKEVVSGRCYPKNQDRLMHVITSDGDKATRSYFRTGQRLGMLTWKDAELKRVHAVHEEEMTTTAVGHYLPFQTGQLCGKESKRPECQTLGRPDKCFRVSPDGELFYISYVEGPECIPERDKLNHFKVGPYEPLAFVQTDSTFIKHHNDVFTDYVAAYLAAILAEARHKRGENIESMQDDAILKECAVKDYKFGDCLNAYKKAFTDIELDPPKPEGPESGAAN